MCLGRSNTDVLQVVSLFYTRDRRRVAEQAGKVGSELPAASCNRQALLSLPLDAYKQHEAQAERGFLQAGKFLHTLHIYRIFDLPYQSQIVPLAAILADIGELWEHEANRTKLMQWYWNGVFGELYGSAVETRIARDFLEVPAWLKGGSMPSTVGETASLVGDAQRSLACQQGNVALVARSSGSRLASATPRPAARTTPA